MERQLRWMLAAMGLFACRATAPDAAASAGLRPPVQAAPLAQVAGAYNIVWDRSAAGMQPPVLHGTLVLEADGSAGLEFAEDRPGTYAARSVSIDGDVLSLEFAATGERIVSATASIRDDGDLEGELALTTPAAPVRALFSGRRVRARAPERDCPPPASD